MDKLKKHICVRITDSQFRKLAEVLVDEQMGKSELIRSIIDDYLKNNINKVQGFNRTLK